MYECISVLRQDKPFLALYICLKSIILLFVIVKIKLKIKCDFVEIDTILLYNKNKIYEVEKL